MIACWPKFKFALILIVILFIQLQMDFDQTQAIYDYEEEEEEQVKQVKTHAKKKEVNLKNTPFIIQDRMMHEWRSEWMNEWSWMHKYWLMDQMNVWALFRHEKRNQQSLGMWRCVQNKNGLIPTPTPRSPPPSGVNEDEGRLLSHIGRGGKPVLLQWYSRAGGYLEFKNWEVGVGKSVNIYTKIFVIMFFVSYNYTENGGQTTDFLWNN